MSDQPKPEIVDVTPERVAVLRERAERMKSTWLAEDDANARAAASHVAALVQVELNALVAAGATDEQLLLHLAGHLARVYRAATLLERAKHAPRIVDKIDEEPIP